MMFCLFVVLAKPMQKYIFSIEYGEIMPLIFCK